MPGRLRSPVFTVLLAALLTQCSAPADGLSREARDVASHAVATYADSSVATLADLIAFRTVRDQGITAADNPEFRAMTAYLERMATAFGFDFTDHGVVVVIGLGDAADRLGLVTHADVQPANPAKWAQDPFTLDTTSEPGRLIGRGVEDDKGPIVTALYAMRALRDRGVPLARRIELIISYTEESDWTPFQEFLAQWQAPALNVALDAEYPVVVAEKGWNAIFLSLPPDAAAADGARLAVFRGGEFLSQIPEDAEALIVSAPAALEQTLRAVAERDTLVRFDFSSAGDSLIIHARGLAAHSSKPWDGRNAITHLATLLDVIDWPPTQAARMVRLVNDLVGTGDYAELFGDLAYAHDFMGPLTLSLTTLGQQDDALVAGINFRSPVGRTVEEIERAIREAVAGWEDGTGVDVDLNTIITTPYYPEDAPHIPILLDVFRFYTGAHEAQPISIGGGTHARLVPNGVNFGPAMPGEPYTGHSEHEFMTREQFVKNLEMYTAMLVELAGRH